MAIVDSSLPPGSRIDLIVVTLKEVINALDIQEESEQAHAVLDQLAPAKPGAVRSLLATALRSSVEYFRQGGPGSASNRSSPDPASPRSRSATTTRASEAREKIRFEPGDPAEICAIEQRSAMTILDAIRRYSESHRGQCQASFRRV